MKLQTLQKENNQADPNLDKKWIRLWDAALSHEMLRKIYFIVKPLTKSLNREC